MLNPITLIRNLIQTGSVFQLSIISTAFSALSISSATISLTLRSDMFIGLGYLFSIVAALFIVLSILS